MMSLYYTNINQFIFDFYSTGYLVVILKEMYLQSKRKHGISV